MDGAFRIFSADVEDGVLTRIGPDMSDTPYQLLVPNEMTRLVEYGPNRPRLEVTLRLEGTRLEVVRLVAEVTDSQKPEAVFISSQFLTQLALPRIIRTIAVESIPNSSTWLFNPENEFLSSQSYRFLAQVYWFEHVSWGVPRGAIMNFTGWSRANTNWHIRRISESYTLPGPHSKKASSPPHGVTP